MKKRLFPIFICLLLGNSLLFSQAPNYKKIADLLDRGEVDSSLALLGKKTPSKTYEKGLWHFYKGKAWWAKDQNGIAYKHVLQAKTYFQSLDSSEKISEANLLLLDILGSQENLLMDGQSILDELEAYAKGKKDPLLSARIYANIGHKYLENNQGQRTLYFYNKAITTLKRNADSLRIAKIEMNKGAVFNSIYPNYDSALYYFKKTMPIFKEKKLNQLISYNYNNQALTYKNQKNYSQALKYYTLSNAIDLKKHDANTRSVYYANLVELYGLMGDYKNAFLLSQKLKSLNDSLNITAQNIAISEIQTKYETAKKEKANLELKTKVEKKTRVQTILWIGLSLSLIIGFIVSYLTMKNAKRKRLIAHQEREIEIQKIEKNLKEQELNTIDLMISGQEKERQRLANDLHDNLGSTLATLKLNFKTLKRNFNKEEAEPVLENAAILIDDAYKKVREISHEKNSGVMANEGLLPGVEQLARKVSGARGVKISVQGFGLTSRLESGLEITIFRIIQELITNIVKHAEATEATISLTNHTDFLNIIVEDNGKGFDSRKKMGKDGMGLSNIEKRIEHLDGTMEIDSSKNQGTSIIIDIPL